MEKKKKEQTDNVFFNKKGLRCYKKEIRHHSAIKKNSFRLLLLL